MNPPSPTAAPRSQQVQQTTTQQARLVHPLSVVQPSIPPFRAHRPHARALPACTNAPEAPPPSRRADPSRHLQTSRRGRTTNSPNTYSPPQKTAKKQRQRGKGKMPGVYEVQGRNLYVQASQSAVYVREVSVQCKQGGGRSVSHGGVMDGERAGVANGTHQDRMYGTVLLFLGTMAPAFISNSS